MGKGFADNLLLNDKVLLAFRRGAWGGTTHLGLGIGAHSDIKELLVEEGHTSFNAPRTQALVGTQAVVEVKLGELAHCFLVEVAGRRCFVEVEVASEDLVGAFAAEYHLNAHRLDDASEQIHTGEAQW